MHENELTETPSTETPTSSSAAPATSAPTPRGSRGCGSIAIGTLLVLIGIPMLICPGPGMAAILSGLGMIGVGLGIKKAAE